MTATIPNPWLTYSEAAHSHASDTAAAIIDPGRLAAAVLIPSSDVIAARTDVLQTVAATVSAGDDISDIHEIFHFARTFLAETNTRAEDFVDLDALEAALAEPLPMFLRDDGYLRRRA